MLLKRIIPCLDMHNGRVVKGIQFQGMQDCGDPLELALEYQRQGADELILLDVSATPEGRPHALEVLGKLRRALSIPLTVGGGIRSVQDAQTLLHAGADKLAINSAAVQRPELLAEIAARFGVQCTVLALDARAKAGPGAGWDVLIHSGVRPSGREALEWAREACALGAGELLLTSWDRDGTRTGYDLELLGCMRAAVQVPLIASGGAAGFEHMQAAFLAGADACLAASIFHDAELSVTQIKAQLRNTGMELRR